MSDPEPVLRTLAWGDPELNDWGAGWSARPAGGLTLLAGDGSGRMFAGTVGEGDGGPVAVSPLAEPVQARDPEGRIEGRVQLCRVSGRVGRDGDERPVDALGVLTWWTSIELERYESIRAVSSWFVDPDEGLALTAFRERKARSHDSDLVAAAVISADGAAPVEDPRLSTTYANDGWPMRAGLELWLPGEDSEHQYPRRASGEATGARAQAAAGGLELRAEPFRWHSRGRDGAGMYILARRT